MQGLGIAYVLCLNCEQRVGIFVRPKRLISKYIHQILVNRRDCMNLCPDLPLQLEVITAKET